VPKFVVRVGYEWVTPCYRDIELDAIDASDAEKVAIALAESDPAFWTDSVECDGEAGSTTVFEIRHAESNER